MIPQEAKILSILSNNDVTFFIPPYQRNYEWTDEQCKIFLEDVIQTYEKNQEGNNTEHFFGAITFFATESTFGQPSQLVLIDGQQRLTTTMLFLVALRDIIDDDKLKTLIDSRYLRNNSVIGDTEYKIKLKQVETDWEAYKKIILGEELSDNDKASAVYRNYQFFTNKLLDLKNRNVDLQEVVNKGLNKFSIVTIELQPDKNSWENPQEIFESMNSLGKPLSLADLVRNYLLLGLNPEKQDKLYKQYWLHMERVIPNQISGFIRDYMQAIKGRSFKSATETNFKELYSQFKEVFKNNSPEDLLSSLSELSTIYSYIIRDNSTGNEKVDRILSDLRYVSITTSYSFLLMLLYAWKKNDFTNDEIIELLEAFEIYAFRRRVIGATSGENKQFPTLVNKIDDLKKAKDKKRQMFEILSKQEINLRLPNDNEMRHEFETMSFYNFKYCKLFLAMVEEKLTKNRPDLDDDNLQIEHIMPQTLNREWNESLGDDYAQKHQEYLNNIGNLTLIRHNQELGNKAFADKKIIYDNHSGLQIAKTLIIECYKWTDQEIVNRANWIIDIILDEVLPIPEDMRKVNNFSIKEKKGKKKHLSFVELQLIGEDINFISDKSIVAHVVGDKKVEFEGKEWKLSSLTKEIKRRKNELNPSGAYQGAQYWEYDGIRLAEIM